MSKRILCLDFDGVLHSYTSGWKGARCIPDPPVDGAIEFLLGAIEQFEVHILSSRSHQWLGRRAMKRWLIDHLCWWADDEDNCWAMMNHSLFGYSFDPLNLEIRHFAKSIVNDVIRWPLFKPPAHVSIDDRAWNFDGAWPDLGDVAAFKPWNKRS